MGNIEILFPRLRKQKEQFAALYVFIPIGTAKST